MEGAGRPVEVCGRGDPGVGDAGKALARERVASGPASEIRTEGEGGMAFALGAMSPSSAGKAVKQAARHISAHSFSGSMDGSELDWINLR